MFVTYKLISSFAGTDFNIGFCLLSFSVKCMRQSIALSESIMDQSDELSTVSSTGGCDSIANAYLKLAEYCQIGYANDTLQGVCLHNVFVPDNIHVYFDRILITLNRP